jgi:hypothetical protein
MNCYSSKQSHLLNADDLSKDQYMKLKLMSIHKISQLKEYKTQLI